MARRKTLMTFVSITSKNSANGPNIVIVKDTKPLMSSLLEFNRVYRLEILSVMLVFSTPLVN
jgi:hypothetical protein